MSDLFHIRVEMVVGPTAWIRFEVCHPDQWDIPSTKTFALLAVVEVYREMKEGLGFIGPRRSIRQDEAEKLVATHPHRAKLEQWLEHYRQFDGAAFTAEAEEVVQVELINEEGNPKRKNSDPDPSATVVLTVKDASILAHFVSGFAWESAVCDCNYWCPRLPQ